jgi:hypothetical protein
LTLAELDLRTAEGKFCAGIRAALVEHVGGNPTPPMQILIGLAALKSLRLELMMSRILSDEQIKEGDDGKFLSWANSLRRDLLALGLERMRELPQSLTDYLREIERRRTLANDADAA